MLSRKRAFLGLFDFLRERKSDLQVFYSSKFKRAFSFTFDFIGNYIPAQKVICYHKAAAGKNIMFQKNNVYNTQQPGRSGKKRTNSSGRLSLLCPDSRGVSDNIRGEKAKNCCLTYKYLLTF